MFGICLMDTAHGAFHVNCIFISCMFGLFSHVHFVIIILCEPSSHGMIGGEERRKINARL